jgi:hypothetical protein
VILAKFDIRATIAMISLAGMMTNRSSRGTPDRYAEVKN